jgi:hypothetical protein
MGASRSLGEPLTYPGQHILIPTDNHAGLGSYRARNHPVVIWITAKPRDAIGQIRESAQGQHRATRRVRSSPVQ